MTDTEIKDFLIGKIKEAAKILDPSETDKEYKAWEVLVVALDTLGESVPEYDGD